MTAVWAVDLPHTEKLVLLALADNANDEGICWPSINTLRRKCGMDERTVRRVVDRLEAGGHVTQVHQSGRSSTFTVHPGRKVTPGAAPGRAPNPDTPGTRPGPPRAHGPDTPGAAPDRTIIEPSDEPSRNHQRVRARRVVPRDTDPEWMLDFKLAYPERAGDQGWNKAVRAASARMGEGHSVAEFLAGAHRYAAFCEATATTGSQYVKQACTFLGPDKPFLLPWHAPPKPETASERILRTLNGSDNSRVIEHDPERNTRAISR